MKKLLLIITIALTANFGFAQKNIILHNMDGTETISNTLTVDSITFGEFRTPGTLMFDSYAHDSIYMEHHSKLDWRATYHGNLSTIPGGFNVIHGDMKFDEANPENIMFDGFVQLSSISTFEPGRDALSHCVPTSLGVTYTTVVDTTLTLAGDTIFTDINTADDEGDWATLEVEAGSMMLVGDNYEGLGSFTYRGVTGDVDVTLYYKSSETFESRGNMITVHNFEAFFAFEAGMTEDDDWYCGSSIKSKVNVSLHMMFEEDIADPE